VHDRHQDRLVVDGSAASVELMLKGMRRLDRTEKSLTKLANGCSGVVSEKPLPVCSGAMKSPAWVKRSPAIIELFFAQLSPPMAWPAKTMP
jgi:hypothetical protein